MKRIVALLFFAALTGAAIPAFADNHPNAPAHPAPPPPRAQPQPQRVAPQPQRVAPQPQRVAPQPQPQRVAPQPVVHQFPLNNDLSPQPAHVAPVVRPPTTTNPRQPTYTHQRQPTNPNQQPTNTNQHPPRLVVRPPVHVAPHQFGPNPHGRVITRPHYSRQPWGWNRGIVWNPAPNYWGGGFWGPFAFGLSFGFWGYYDWNGYPYYSYQVQPGTPGAELLEEYQLTQTPCGPPNLVVIWGPDNSVICAFPNDLVGPGEYTIDPTTLTLVSPNSSNS